MPHTSATSRFRLSGLALGLLMATPVFAHDPLATSWCLAPNTSPVIVATFNFTPTTLVNYRADRLARGASNEDPDCDRSGSRSCGIVDDWHWASEMSIAFCGGQNSQVQAPGSLGVSSRGSSQSAMPFVSSPAVFNVSDHHRLYRFSTGHLVGVCVECRPTVVQPAPIPVEPSVPSDR